MIERLEQLTISQFVDLVCGDTEVLQVSGSADKAAIVLRNVVMGYRNIADPGGTHSYLQRVEEWIKAKIEVIVFTMCLNLAALKQIDRAREVLDAYGLSSSGWNDSRVEGAINAKLSQAQRALNDIDALNENADVERENIRAMFDAQTAALMAHFKFQIDPVTIKATLYANLVARHNREIKAQMAAMRKK